MILLTDHNDRMVLIYFVFLYILRQIEDCEVWLPEFYRQEA